MQAVVSSVWMLRPSKHMFMLLLKQSKNIIGVPSKPIYLIHCIWQTYWGHLPIEIAYVTVWWLNQPI